MRNIILLFYLFILYYFIPKAITYIYSNLIGRTLPSFFIFLIFLIGGSLAIFIVKSHRILIDILKINIVASLTLFLGELVLTWFKKGILFFNEPYFNIYFALSGLVTVLFSLNIGYLFSRLFYSLYKGVKNKNQNK
jgi:hypothetical protein